MKKAMLSQPMAGKTDEEIAAAREKAIKTLEEKGYEIVNTLFTDEWYSKESMKQRGVETIPLCFLAKSLENMSKCHVAYFCRGWKNARGCKLEHDAAVAYGMEILYEEKPETKTLRFEGYSDDTFAETNMTREDLDNCASCEPVQCIVDAGTFGRVMVVGQFSRASAGNGCWMAGLSKVDEEDTLPNWNFRITEGMSPYSIALEMDVPEDFQLTWFNNGKKEGEKL